MGIRLLGRCPKIGSLIDLHDKYPDGFEASLIERGLRYREVGVDPRFTWWDMYAVIVTLPYDSPLERQRNGKDWH